jgi:CheY-like chemotaxis protein
MNREVIVIDDNMDSKDPFVRVLQKTYPEYAIKLFNDANSGVQYIFDNLTKRIIVFLDCRFDAGIQGIEALNIIRQKTSLVYIVMMSANNLLQQTEAHLSEMINHHGIYYITNTDTDKAIALIKEINELMDCKLDCALEEWMEIQKNQNSNNENYLNIGSQSFSIDELLKEIRTKSEVGRKFEKDLIQLTIYLLLKKTVSI